MEQIIKQAPDYISQEKIQDVYVKNSSNAINTLVELWDIKEEKKEITKEKQKWNEIRETCDVFDTEMYKQIRGGSNKPIENKSLNNIPITNCNTPEKSCDLLETCCDCICNYDNDINNCD